MASEYTWPKPWLLQLYARVVEEGCLRIALRGKTPEQNEHEYRSFRAAFLRCRRKADASFQVQMRPEFQQVSIRFEPDRGKVLLMYDALPDGELLPIIESVSEDEKHRLPQPIGSRPHPTPEEEPDDFDATKFVGGLIENIEIEDDEDNGGTTEF